MIRWFKKLLYRLLVICFLAAFAYLVLLPRVLPRDYAEYVEKYAAEYQLEESLVYAVIFCESHFDKDAVSPAGAIGLMQVTEETGLWAAGQVGLEQETLNLKDPETNIRLGCWYLKCLDASFSGGQGYRIKHAQILMKLDEIPFGETKSYVKRVQLAEKLYRIAYRF